MRKKLPPLKLWIYLLLTGFALFLLTSTVFAKEYRIAVVKDGPSEDDQMITEIGSEINHMIGEKNSVTFVESEEFNARWQKDRYRAVIENAMIDSNIDMILGLGVLVLQEAAESDMVLSKPFISATAVNGHLPELSYSQNDHSLKKNLAVMVLVQDAKNDIGVFTGIWKFKKLYVGISKEIFEDLHNLIPVFNQYSKTYGIEIIPVPVGTNVEEVLNSITDDVEAVYLIKIPRLDTDGRKQLIDGLNARKIPTFSALGSPDLELGALATNRLDIKQEVIRRSALNIFNMIEGASTSDLPVFLVSDPKLQINARTAVSIGYSPNFEARVSATFLYPEAFEQEARPLRTIDVINMAKDGNKDLFISQAQTEIAGKDQSIFRGSMLPQLGVSGSYEYYDTKAVGIILPEQWLRLNLNLRQMIFEDRTISDYRASKRKYEATKYLNESTLLNVYQNAVSNFLWYSQSRLIQNIQVSNLKLTEGNLDIAKMRVDVGSSGMDEVYRWQAELAKRKTNVLSSEALVESRRIALNQVLGVDQSNLWIPEEVNIDPASFSWPDGSFSRIFESTIQIQQFTSALLEYALKSSPEINLLSKEKEAQEIILGQRKRSYLLPNVSANVYYGNNLDYIPESIDLGKHNVQAGITASLPLLEGTRRIYDVQKQQIRLNEINFQLLKAQELVEKRVRSAIKNLEASFPNIKYSEDAAKNARLNFEVVRDKYANGIVNITDLLEAQTTTLNAESQAVSAKYTFLTDLIELQRAIAFFTETKTDEEQQVFIKTIQDRMNTTE